MLTISFSINFHITSLSPEICHTIRSINKPGLFALHWQFPYEAVLVDSVTGKRASLWNTKSDIRKVNGDTTIKTRNIRNSITTQKKCRWTGWIQKLFQYEMRLKYFQFFFPIGISYVFNNISYDSVHLQVYATLH